MALNAVFRADFTSFYDAVTKAQVKLVDLSEGAGKVGASLDKMTKSFSGQKIIQDAHLMTAAMVNVGGITSLTDKELRKLGATVGEASDKMRRMGMDVPPGFQKITDAAAKLGTTTTGTTSLLSGLAAQLAGMFTIGAIVAFGREVLAAGDKIQKMADQTGLGTDEVQRLQYIAGQSGVSMETLVSAVQNLQQRLGDDNTGAAGAMRKLGINADAFAKLNTYQQVLTLSDALRQVTDANERASLGAAIFGKTWKEVGPAVLSQMKALGDEAPVMSDKTVKSLDRAGDALDLFKRQMLVWGAAVVNGFLDAELAAEDFLTRFNPSNWGLAASQVKKIRDAIKEGDGLAGAFDQAAKGVAKLTPALQGVKAVIEPTADETQVFNERLRDSVKANEAAAKAAEETKKKYADWLVVLRDHNFMLTKWQGTILGTIPALGTFNERIDLQEDLLENGVRVMELMVFETDKLGKVTQVAGGAFQGLGGMTKTFSEDIEDAAENTDEAAEKTKRFQNELDKLSGAFVAIAQVSGDSMSQVAEDIGIVLASMSAASQSGEAFKKGLKDIGKGNTVKGLSGVAAGAIGVYGAFQQATSGTSKLKSALGGAAVGFSVAGPWGAAVGAAIGLIKSFAKASEETAKVSPLRDAFFKAAGGLEVLNPKVVELTGNLKLVEDIFKAKTVEQYEAAMKNLAGAFEFQEKALQTLDETAKKYGFTIAELGPAWQKQELDKKAQELFKDYQVLTSAGVDHTTVLGKMADAVNEYVNNALSMGAEVPAAMKPMLEAMAKNGQLLDANGNKIVDLEAAGVTFALSMSEGFKSLITEVQKLTDVIAKSLGVSMDTVAKKANIAEKAFDDWGETAVDAARDVAEAVDDVSFGHSPGGLKEFPILLKKAETAFKHFSRESTQALKGTDRQLSDIAIGGGRPMSTPSLMATGGAQGFIDGGARSGESRTTIIKVEVDGRVIAEAVNYENEQQNQLRRRMRAA